jgi:CheY-like chemotaxis protein
MGLTGLHLTASDRIYRHMVERENKEASMSVTTLVKPGPGPIGWIRRLLGSTAPAPPKDTDSRTAAMAPSPADSRHLSKILVVDDDPVFVRATAARLTTAGYNVITATDGSEAIRAARKQKPDLVVLDVNLPLDVSGVPWDGFRVTAWLRHFDDLKNIPIVMVTGGDPQKCTRAAFSAGAKAFFHKRMDPGHLMTLVNHTLNRKATPSAPGASAAPKPAAVTFAAGTDTNFQI